MSTDQGADERRIRYLLHRQGIGTDIPPRPTRTPATPARDDSWWDELYNQDTADTHPRAVRTTPDKARISGGLIPPWRKGPVTDLHEPRQDTSPDEPDGPDKTPPAATPDKPETDPAKDDPEEYEEAPGPDESTPKTTRRPTQWAQARTAKINPRMRWLLYNGTAAGVGYAIHLVGLFGRYLTPAGTGSPGLGFVLAVGGAMAAWKLTEPRPIAALLEVLPIRATITRAAAIAGAGAAAVRYAPTGLAWLGQYSADWGLDTGTVSLLVTALGGCTVLYLALDDPAKYQRAAVRWTARIPLASAVLAIALYAPGATQ